MDRSLLHFPLSLLVFESKLDTNSDRSNNPQKHLASCFCVGAAAYNDHATTNQRFGAAEIGSSSSVGSPKSGECFGLAALLVSKMDPRNGVGPMNEP